jgi:hypothetical protein
VPEIDFRLMAGGLALIDARRAARPTWLADLCCGLVPLAAGTARFLDRDWSAVAPDYADALRGRIRRIFFSGSWIGFMDVATNILLPQLHHTRDDPSELLERATTLCCCFRFARLAAGPPRRAYCSRPRPRSLRPRLSWRSRFRAPGKPRARKSSLPCCRRCSMHWPQRATEVQLRSGSRAVIWSGATRRSQRRCICGSASAVSCPRCVRHDPAAPARFCCTDQLGWGLGAG